MKEEYKTIMVVSMLYPINIVIHWFISGFLFVVSNQNLEWTRMEIFLFLTMTMTTIYLFIIAFNLVKARRKEEENLEVGD